MLGLDIKLKVSPLKSSEQDLITDSGGLDMSPKGVAVKKQFGHTLLFKQGVIVLLNCVKVLDRFDSND